MLISKIDPVYPLEAKNEHVEGTVVLEGTVGIGRDCFRYPAPYRTRIPA